MTKCVVPYGAPILRLGLPPLLVYCVLIARPGLFYSPLEEHTLGYFSRVTGSRYCGRKERTRLRVIPSTMHLAGYEVRVTFTLGLPEISHSEGTQLVYSAQHLRHKPIFYRLTRNTGICILSNRLQPIQGTRLHYIRRLTHIRT